MKRKLIIPVHAQLVFFDTKSFTYRIELWSCGIKTPQQDLRSFLCFEFYAKPLPTPVGVHALENIKKEEEGCPCSSGVKTMGKKHIQEPVLSVFLKVRHIPVLNVQLLEILCYLEGLFVSNAKQVIQIMQISQNFTFFSVVTKN